MNQTSTDGLKTWQTSYRDQSTPVTVSTVRTIADSNGNTTTTVTNPDSSSQVSSYSYGRLQSVTQKNAGGSQVSQTSYTYDAFGRQYQVTDARNGASSYTYNNADQVTTVTAPNLGTGEAPQVTATFYDKMGQVVGTQNPDGTATTNFYYQTGQLQQTSGSRVYPVAYTYDPQGRMATMTTWQNPGASAVTRWNYDANRGWLNSKDYPDPTTGQAASSSGPSYTYWPSGRLKTRTWKRGTVTTYAYTAAGDLYTVSYSDSTPGVTYGYDRLGRRQTVTDNGITTSLTYNDANQYDTLGQVSARQ
jgi:YD repeat-containing protein